MRKFFFLFLLAFAGFASLTHANEFAQGKTCNQSAFTTKDCTGAFDSSNSTAGSYWETQNQAVGANWQNITVDLNSTYTYNITNVQMLFNTDAGCGGGFCYYGNVEVYYSNDNSTFVFVQNISSNTLVRRTFNFTNGIQARYWRLNINDPHGDGVIGYMLDFSVYGSIFTGTNAAVIYQPTNTTFYNASGLRNLVYSINSSVNSSSMQVYITNNSITYFAGYLANASTNTTQITQRNGQNSVSVTFFDGTNNFSSATTFYTVTNGLNISAYNASQATSTYLTLNSVNVSSSTNSSTTYGVVSPQILETRTIPNGGVVNVYANLSGYEDRNVTIFSNSSLLYTVNLGMCRLQELRLNGTSNTTAVTSWIAQIFSGTNVTSYSTSNGSIYFSICNVPLGNIVVQATASGYNSTNTTINLNASSEINFTLTSINAGIQIFAYDEASCSSVCQRIYFGVLATNGSSTTTDYNLNYFINASYTAFPQGSVTMTINNSINGTYFNRNYLVTISSSSAFILNTYLLNQSSTVGLATYCVQTAGSVGIMGASLTFQKLINNSYVTVAQGTTGSDGCYSLYMDFLTTYQVIASASGFNTGTFTSQPKTISYIILTSSSAVKGFQTSYADDKDLVLTRLLPEDSALNDSSVLVNFTIYSNSSTLTNWGMFCWYNGSAIYNTNVTGSPSGGSTTSNITLSNKTNPLSFYCYGLFDRTGYNTTFINRTYYISTVNASYYNTSVQGALDRSKNAGFTSQTLVAASIIFSLIGTAALAAFVPVGSGLVFLGFITAFALIGWMDWLFWLLIAIFSAAFVYFNSRQF